MRSIFRNILGVIAGWIIGSLVNLGLIKCGHSLLPIEGIDPSNMEQLASVMPGLEPIYFIFPFLAHAMGTLTGAVITGLIVSRYKMKFALSIGMLYLIFGIIASFMIPAPTWFVTVDILFAYIPMAWIGGKVAVAYSS